VTQYIVLLTIYTLYMCYFVGLLDCLFSGFHTVHYPVIVKANSDYINSDYSGVRCTVYIYMRVSLFGLFLRRTNLTDQ